MAAEGQTKDIMCVFGDSYVENHMRPAAETWHAKVAGRLGYEYVNCGRNGSSVAFDRSADGFGKAMTERVAELPRDARVILLIAGHNDADMIARNDTCTIEKFRTALDRLLKDIKTAHPGAAIGYVTPWYVNRPGFTEVIAAIKQICAANGVPVLDSATSGIEVNNADFRKKYFQGEKDSAHLNAAGHNLLVDRGERFVKSLTGESAESISELLTIFRPENPNGKTIVICPGGAYRHHAMQHEGTEVAAWLSGLGYTCAVLQYHFPQGNPDIPLADSRAAVCYMRRLAGPQEKVGIMGFSAGGHLAAATSTLSDGAERPDFQILLYPVISMDPATTHMFSRENLIGPEPTDSLVRRYSAELQVSAQTPPAILILSADDSLVKPDNSLLYFKALRTMDVPAEMHIYPTGGHGWGMHDNFTYRKQWRAELENWLDKL